MCCKEMGHSIENCYRDPNIKTSYGDGIENEIKRIAEITDNRRFFSDTAVVTTKYLKMCVKIPIVDEDLVKGDLRIRKLTLKNQNVFNRGVMHFDDYNYGNYNDWILKIDPRKIIYD